MNKKDNSKPKDHFQYDLMDDFQLRQLLKDDAATPHGEGLDTQTLLYIMELLAQRRQLRENSKSPEEAWAAFQESYAPGQEDREKTDGSWIRFFKQPGLKRYSRGFSAVAAVLAVVVICGFVTAGARRTNRHTPAPIWCEEYVYFPVVGQTPTNGDSSPKLEDFRKALWDNGVSTDMSPKWIPDRFQQLDIYESRVMGGVGVVGSYQSSLGEEEYLQISIHTDNPKGTTHYDHSGGLLELYKTDNADYYLFWNYDVLNAIWLQDGYECIIFGDISVEEMKQILDTIGE